MGVGRTHHLAHLQPLCGHKGRAGNVTARNVRSECLLPHTAHERAQQREGEREGEREGGREGVPEGEPEGEPEGGLANERRRNTQRTRAPVE